MCVCMYVPPVNNEKKRNERTPGAESIGSRVPYAIEKECNSFIAIHQS